MSLDDVASWSKIGPLRPLGTDFQRPALYSHLG